jgi:hypothetical protein
VRATRGEGGDETGRGVNELRRRLPPSMRWRCVGPAWPGMMGEPERVGGSVSMTGGVGVRSNGTALSVGIS